MRSDTYSREKKEKFSVTRSLLTSLILLILAYIIWGFVHPAEAPAEETAPTAAPAVTAVPATAAPEITPTPGVKIIEATAEPTQAPSLEEKAENLIMGIIGTVTGTATSLEELEQLDTVAGAVGQYTFSGENGDWVLDLRDNDLFTITDPDGKLHTGEGWSLNDDGTVTCGPTDIYGADFAFSGGCSRWAFKKGDICFPVTNG